MEGTALRTEPAPRRKRAQHLGPERRRPLLLDAALSLFLEHGYEGTSMDAVARAAGVSKPVVYSAFENKETLFRDLLTREEERILGETGSAFANTDLADPEQAMKDGFTAFLRAVDSSPDVYRLIFFQEGGGNAALARRIQRGRQTQVDALSAFAKSWLTASGVEAGPRDGASLDDLAGLLGFALVGLAEAGARALLSDREAWTPESVGETLAQLAARGQAAI